MALSKAIEGSNHTAQQITWKDERGNAVDLTGATITGKMHPHDDSSTVSDIGGGAGNGTLTISDASNGVFNWTYGDNNIDDVGVFIVQFTATYAADSSKEKCFKEQFIVEDALDV